MNLRQLRYFIQIVEQRSFTAAAERLAVAQPALSRQIRALEDELKVPLLLRHGRGVSPTEDGLEFARRAKSILEDVQHLTGAFSQEQAPLVGTIRLGLPPTVSNILATHLIERTMQAHPALKLQVSAGFSGHIEDWLARGKIDLGVAYGEQKSTLVDTRPMLREKLFLVQPPSAAPVDEKPIALGKALSLPLILPNTGHGLRSKINAAAQAEGVALNVVYEIDILEAMLGLVERGRGYTILPKVSVIPQMEAGRLVTRAIEDPELDRTLVLMTPGLVPVSQLHRRFADFLTGEIHDMVATGHWPGTRL